MPENKFLILLIIYFLKWRTYGKFAHNVEREQGKNNV